MSSEDAKRFLKHKYTWLFGFFDTSGDGTLQRSDFEARAQRACEAVHGFYSQHPQGADMLSKHFENIQKAQHNAYTSLFDGLCRAIDKSGTGEISKRDWISFCRHVKASIDSSGQMPGWFHQLLVDYWSNVLDFNGNGKLEYYELCFMGDAPPDVAMYCYDKLTEGNSIQLTQAMFLDMTSKYMASGNPQCKSRYMFGFIDHTQAEQQQPQPRPHQ